MNKFLSNDKKKKQEIFFSHSPLSPLTKPPKTPILQHKNIIH